MGLIPTSLMGVDFEGKTLNEDTLDGGELICYRGKLYTSGNRRGESVELYDIITVVYLETVSCKEVRLVKNQVV